MSFVPEKASFLRLLESSIMTFSHYDTVNHCAQNDGPILNGYSAPVMFPVFGFFFSFFFIYLIKGGESEQLPYWRSMVFDSSIDF